MRRQRLQEIRQVRRPRRDRLLCQWRAGRPRPRLLQRPGRRGWPVHRLIVSPKRETTAVPSAMGESRCPISSKHATTNEVVVGVGRLHAYCRVERSFQGREYLMLSNSLDADFTAGLDELDAIYLYVCAVYMRYCPFSSCPSEEWARFY